MQPEAPPPELPPPPLLTGKKVLVYFLAFFALFMSVNIIFMITAERTHTGVVTEEAYQKGLEYNKVIEEANKQDALGWTHRLVVRLDLEDKRRVTLRLKDAKKHKLTGAGVLVRFYRPVGKEGLTLDVTLQEKNPGTYVALVTFPERGKWDAYIGVRKGDAVYRAHDQVNAP